MTHPHMEVSPHPPPLAVWVVLLLSKMATLSCESSIGRVGSRFLIVTSIIRKAKLSLGVKVALPANCIVRESAVLTLLRVICQLPPLIGIPKPGSGMGVGVSVGVAVGVGLGVIVGVSVDVGLGVIVGPKNCPGPQPENNRLTTIRTDERKNFWLIMVTSFGSLNRNTSAYSYRRVRRVSELFMESNKASDSD
jgi:hypothetical protein